MERYMIMVNMKVNVECGQFETYEAPYDEMVYDNIEDAEENLETIRRNKEQDIYDVWIKDIES